MQTLRQTAIVARISDVIENRFVRKEGLEPSYVITKFGQKISRVKLMGTIVDKFVSDMGNYSTITIEDDTASMRVKAFQDNADVFDEFNLGDLVTVVGKVREYNDENYVIPEIVKRVTDPNHELLHRLRVLKGLLRHKKMSQALEKERKKFTDVEGFKKYASEKYKIDPEVVESFFEGEGVEEGVDEKDYKSLVLETLEGMDDGEGVGMRELMERCKLPDDVFEEVINDLLSSGICYEPKPGILRRV